jgi:hypothetical protein
MQWNGNECWQNGGNDNDKTIIPVQTTIEQKATEVWGILKLFG